MNFQYTYQIEQHSLQMRVAYMGLIFRKVCEKFDQNIVFLKNKYLLQILRLSSHSLNNIGSGEIINLISNDARRIEVAFQFFNYLWVRSIH